METTTALLMASLVFAGPVAGPQQNDRGGAFAGRASAVVSPDGNSLDLPHCLVRLIRDVEVPAREPGVLTKINLREGEPVKENDVIAETDNGDAVVRLAAANLELKLAQKEASNRVEIDAAIAAADVADAEYAESKNVNRRSAGSIPFTRLRREDLTAKRSHLQVKVAEMEYDVAQITAEVRTAQVKVAENSLERHNVVAPLDGIVESRYRDVGEWVEKGTPIFRVVFMKRVRIVGYVKLAQYPPHLIDDKAVTVTVTHPAMKPETFPGVINYVSQIVESNGTYRVFADIDNRTVNGKHYILRQGMKVSMRLHLDR